MMVKATRMRITLASGYDLHSFCPPATSAQIACFIARYPEISPGYLDVIREATSIVLLWRRCGELRLWGPDEAIGMATPMACPLACPGRLRSVTMAAAS